MTEAARRAADEIIAWWREYRQLASVPEWYDPLRDRIAAALAQGVRETWAEAAKIVGLNLVHLSQRAISWHEVKDYLEILRTHAAVLRLEEKE